MVDGRSSIGNIPARKYWKLILKSVFASNMDKVCPKSWLMVLVSQKPVSLMVVPMLGWNIGLVHVGLFVVLCHTVECADLKFDQGGLLHWSSQCRYLGVHFVSGRAFKCSFDHSKCQFFKALNAIFSKVGRFTSEEVVLNLIRAKCLPMELNRAQWWYATKIRWSSRLLAHLWSCLKPDRCIYLSPYRRWLYDSKLTGLWNKIQC